MSCMHVGHNNIDYYGRLMLRHALKARVKYPFRASIQVCDHIKTASDKQLVMILNSYIMSSLPPEVHGKGREEYGPDAPTTLGRA